MHGRWRQRGEGKDKFKMMMDEAYVGALILGD
jgi:hypothetical protein